MSEENEIQAEEEIPLPRKKRKKTVTLPDDPEEGLLIVDGKTKKIHKRSSYLLDMLTTDDE